MSIYRPNELAALLGVNKSTIWRWIQAGSFPRPIKLGSRLTGWPVAVVDEWIATRPVTDSVSKAA